MGEIEKIKITQCSNSILWYSKYIGSVFEVVRRESNSVWVREPDCDYHLINWVYLNDCEFI